MQTPKRVYNILGFRVYTKYGIKPILESKAILEQQLKKLNDEKNVFVLCTCVFYIPEYNKKLIESESSD